MDLVTLLATAAGESETSETPFFVIGGALAVFAVVASLIGIMRPNLPSSAAGALSGIGALLAVATMVTMLAVS